MALPNSGRLGLDDIQSEFGGDSKLGAQSPNIGINTGSKVAISDFYGASARDTVIYEHNVSPVATTDTSGKGNSIDFGNGYGIGLLSSMNNGGNPEPGRQLLMKKNASADGTLDPIGVVRYNPGTGWGIPSNVCSQNWSILVDINSSKLPPGHKEIWDEVRGQAGGRLTSSPVKGYKVTFHKWHDLSNYSSRNISYSKPRYCSPSSAANQSYNTGTGGGGTVTGILQTPRGTVTTELNTKGYTDFLNKAHGSNPYGFTVGETSPPTPVAQNNSQGWYFAIKKIEMIL